MTSNDLGMLILSMISWIVLPMLYRIFKDPTRVLSGKYSRRGLKAIILVYAGFAIIALLLGGRFYSSLFVAYPLLYSVVSRDRIRSTWLFSSRFAMFIIPFCLLWFEEIFAVLDYYGVIIPHFIHYIGYYLGYAFVIRYFFRRWSFSFAQVMTIGGLFGLLIEGEFMMPQLFLQGLSGSPESLLYALIAAPFIFITHGFYLAGPYLLFHEEINQNPNANKRQIGFLSIAILVIPLLMWGIWSMIIGAGGFDPSGII
jgi:hypothetical protein